MDKNGYHQLIEVPKKRVKLLILGAPGVGIHNMHINIYNLKIPFFQILL